MTRSRSRITPSGTHDGIDWAASEHSSNGRTWCTGYVRLPEGHPWRAVTDTSLESLVVPCLPYEVSYLDENGWLGWDTAFRPPLSLERVEELTRLFAEYVAQVPALAGIEPFSR